MTAQGSMPMAVVWDNDESNSDAGAYDRLTHLAPIGCDVPRQSKHAAVEKIKRAGAGIRSKVAGLPR